MNPLNPTYVSRLDFRRALNLKCYKEFGVGLNDLPDIICIDDVWWENMVEKEAITMIDSCIDDFRDDMGFKFEPRYDTVTGLPAPTYTSIDE